MRCHRLTTFWILSSIVMTPLLGSVPAQEIPSKKRCVAVISIDGLPAWAWDDPKLPMPTLRRLTREGVLAKGMTVSNPSVTWPNHTTLVTGVRPAKHGVLFNGFLVRQGERAPARLESGHDKSELVQATTVYDLAHEAGLTTAQVNWVAIQNAGTITWAFPEVPSPSGLVEREMIAEGDITASDLNDFSKGTTAWRDHYFTEAAAHIIRKHKPNLLLLHLVNTDAMNHRYGPKSWASQSAYAYADACVRRVLDALEAAGLKGQSTLLLVSDHGFKTVTQMIRPNAILRGQGILKVEAGKVVCDAYVIPEGGTAMVYVTNPAERQRLVVRLKEIFAKAEGVERVLEQNDFAALGMPDSQQNKQMGDLVLVAKEGYAFSGDHEGLPLAKVEAGAYQGHHGYPSTDPDMNATFLAWGYGIRSSAELGRIENVDVAPTIAALLDLKMGAVEGRVLRQILLLGPKDSN